MELTIHPLVQEILTNGLTRSWYEYAVKFSIRPDGNRDQRRKAAHGIWENYTQRKGNKDLPPPPDLRPHVNPKNPPSHLSTTSEQKLKGKIPPLELKRQTFDKDGELLSETWGKQPEPDKAPNVDGLTLTGITTHPNGGAWLKYANVKQYGLDPEDAAAASERLQGVGFNPPKSEDGSGIGLVDFSDLHTGAVLKYAIETVKTLPFDLEILTRYMDDAAAMVNAYNFKKLHVFLPGDLVESFTAFNHRDTWRHIQANQGGVVILAYNVLKRLLQNLNNVERVYMVEGNHDRMVAQKEGNTRKGVAELIAFFLSENSGLNIDYHPFLTGTEIDGAFHMMTHGDHKPFAKNDFWFRYGRQGMYNVLRTGHFHGFNVLRQTNETLHYQCPSIFPGNFFSESIGFDAVPAITIVTHTAGVPRIDYRPLTK